LINLNLALRYAQRAIASLMIQILRFAMLNVRFELYPISRQVAAAIYLPGFQEDQ
jgi:hypothetical protein